MIIPPPTTRTCGLHSDRLGHSFAEYGEALSHRFFIDHKRRTDLYRAAAESHGSKHQYTFLNALLNDARSERAVGFLRSGLYARDTGDQAFAIDTAESVDTPSACL